MNKLLLGVSKHQEAALRHLSQAQGIPMSEIVRRALDFYLSSGDGVLKTFLGSHVILPDSTAILDSTSF